MSVPREDALGHFDSEARGIEPVVADDGGERACQRGIGEIAAGNIDRNRPGLVFQTPALHRLGGQHGDETREFAAASVTVEEGEEEAGWHQPIIGMEPAHIGFGAQYTAAREFDLRLEDQMQMPRPEGEVDVAVGQPKGTAVHLEAKFFGRGRAENRLF